MIIHRESGILSRPFKPKRLRLIINSINKLDLPKNSRILDFGGNNFKEYCDKKSYEYVTLNLEKPQKFGTGGYDETEITYDGRNIPFEKNSFDLIIISFVLHHTSSNTIHLLKQLKNITTKYMIICEDLRNINHPIKWHIRCFNHQQNGLYRSDEEWKFIFKAMRLKVIDALNIRLEKDSRFSKPLDHVYRVQYTLMIKKNNTQ